ncbi:MAG TPA: hypothetical protein VK689_22925 [Armatimonadota bacterium]|nr:hypothetical protein [Armatimonadota bacterium]
MIRLAHIAAAALAAAVLLAPGAPARAQDEARPLIIGATRLFTIRSGDTLNGRTLSVDDRIGHVQDVYAKYLGGQFGRFTWKKWGDRVHHYLNGQFALAVTPQDAAATGYKNTEQLAAIWLRELQRGFDESHTQSGAARG